MINAGNLRTIFEAEGYTAGMRRWNHLIGLANERGVRYTNPQTFEPEVRDPVIRSNEFSNLRVLTEAIGRIGGLDPQAMFSQENIRRSRFADFMLEAADGAVQPSAFLNINAWGAATGGLLEVRALEAYNEPTFIGDTLMETVQSRQRSEKRPGVAAPGDDAQVMTPSQAHPRVQLSEKYIETPETEKTGLAIDVTREAAFFDITGGQVLSMAEVVGGRVRYRKEVRQLRTVLGIDNSYSRNGTATNTYLTSGAYTNSQTNLFTSWEDVDTSRALLNAMRDPENSEIPIMVGGTTIFCMPDRAWVFGQRLNAVQVIANTNFDTAATSFPIVQTVGTNPATGMTIISSEIAKQALTDSGVSAANANNRWWHGDFRKAFQYVQNFPFRVQRVDASDYQMADADLILSLFADEMGISAVIDPRYVINNTE